MARPTKEEQAAKRQIEDERIASIVATALATAQDKMRSDLRAELLAEVSQVAAETMPAVPAVNLTHPQGGDGDKGFASALALAIANLSAQGTNKAPFVPPEKMEAWANARERMVALIIASRAKYGETGSDDDLPKYRLLKSQYLNEMLIQPTVVNTITHTVDDQFIVWDEPPNEQMAPANVVAEAIFSAFMGSIGDTIIKDKPENQSIARTSKGLIMGVRNRGGNEGMGPQMRDPRIRTDKASSVKHVAVLGTVAAPAAMR